MDGDEEERNAYSRYRDQLDEEDDEGDETSIRREITNLNSQSNLASLVEGNRSRPSVYVNDQDRQDRWRND